jgi:hypothetical protein
LGKSFNDNINITLSQICSFYSSLAGSSFLASVVAALGVNTMNDGGAITPGVMGVPVPAAPGGIIIIEGVKVAPASRGVLRWTARGGGAIMAANGSNGALLLSSAATTSFLGIILGGGASGFLATSAGSSPRKIHLLSFS